MKSEPLEKAERFLERVAPNAQTTEENKRQLPEDPGEFDKAIAPCKVMVKPVLQGISRMCRSLGTSELEKDELDSGTVAFSALMYQHGAMLDARILVALWLASIVPSRVIEFVEKKRKEDRQEKLGYMAKRELPSGEAPTPAMTVVP